MVKHTQTIHCLSVFDHFVELALEGLSWTIETEGKKKQKQNINFQSFFLQLKGRSSIGFSR